jgi:hypothetical protein
MNTHVFLVVESLPGRRRIAFAPIGISFAPLTIFHNHGVDPQKTESQQLRIRVRKASGGISESPSKIIRTELQSIVK